MTLPTGQVDVDSVRVVWMRAAKPADAAGPAGVVHARLPYLDRLKVLLVAGVIFGHGWAGYSTIASWAYSDVREVTIHPVTETVLEAVLGPFGLFAMGMFFLIAGLSTPASIARKGRRRYVRDRLVRLGIPLAVFTLLFWPPVAYGLDRLARVPTGSLWSAFAGAVWSPDTVHVWFLGVLLLYSLGYAAWRGTEARPRRHTALTLPQVVGLAVAVAGGSFLIRGWFPLETSQYAGLHLPQWPQYLALFWLGVAGAGRGWFDPVPDHLRRACGIAALLGALSIGGLAFGVALGGVPAEEFLGGWHAASLATAAAEGLLAVTVAVWLVGIAQRRLTAPAAPSSPAVRSAYAAFVIQGHVLVGLALLLRPLDIPAEPKALAVSTLGVVASFALGWILVSRTPAGRIL